MEERLQWIMTRRSTRRFSQKTVEEEKLDAVIEAGRAAPSGGNNQTTRFIVIRDREIL
ncbi:MAG: nitroreductase family protein, partial [Clostridia bacterium]|nr:nitroreductase family protein [Clostridia bacterium]